MDHEVRGLAQVVSKGTVCAVHDAISVANAQCLRHSGSQLSQVRGAVAEREANDLCVVIMAKRRGDDRRVVVVGEHGVTDHENDTLDARGGSAHMWHHL